MDKTFTEFRRADIKFLPLSERKNKIFAGDMYRPGVEIKNYENFNLDILARHIVAARRKSKPVIWMMGAHVIRRRNSRLIVDLLERGIITHVATNGACAIHDFELAYQGATCEDVETYIRNGRFGNWEEVGFWINNAVRYGYLDWYGYGQSVGRLIETGRILDFSNKELKIEFPLKGTSIFAAAYRLGIPITVHKSIGQDITDQHPDADFEVLGGASGRDFLIFTESISHLEGGGVFLNLGTQVMGPEVYLKALSMARNVAVQEGREIKNFTTAVFDIVDLGHWRKEDSPSDPVYYFRPKKTILIRTIKDGGESFYIRGDFAITIPALYKKIIDLLEGGKK